MEKGRKTLVWLLVLMVLVTLSLFVYFLIFSPSTANIQEIISLRHKYIETLFNIRQKFGFGRTDNCWYLKQPIQTLRTSPDPKYKYVYSLSGKIVEINEENDTVTIECSSGNQYVVGTIVTKADWYAESGWVVIEQGRNMEIENPREHPFYFFANDLTRSSEKDMYYTEGQVYDFVWSEDRELSEIYKYMRGNPNRPVNLGDSIVIGLLR